MTAAGLFLVSVALIMWGASALGKHRAERRRQIQAARLRHPSVRQTMTPEEAQYHASRQWGR